MYVHSYTYAETLRAFLTFQRKRIPLDFRRRCIQIGISTVTGCLFIKPFLAPVYAQRVSSRIARLLSAFFFFFTRRTKSERTRSRSGYLTRGVYVRPFLEKRKEKFRRNIGRHEERASLQPRNPKLARR